MAQRFRCLQVLIIGVMFGLVPVLTVAQDQGAWQTYGTENGEWRSYAGNIAGQKY